MIAANLAEKARQAVAQQAPAHPTSPLPDSSLDRLLWLSVREACIIVANAIERRYNLGSKGKSP